MGYDGARAVKRAHRSRHSLPMSIVIIVAAAEFRVARGLACRLGCLGRSDFRDLVVFKSKGHSKSQRQTQQGSIHTYYTTKVDRHTTETEQGKRLSLGLVRPGRKPGLSLDWLSGLSLHGSALLRSSPPPQSHRAVVHNISHPHHREGHHPPLPPSAAPSAGARGYGQHHAEQPAPAVALGLTFPLDL